MTQQDLSLAKDPDLRASLQAMFRAAQLARQTALQTGTDIVVVDENQQIVRLSAVQLQQHQVEQMVPELFAAQVHQACFMNHK